ncbi:MAG TPA: TetR/AcrR family transcriptional regulator [Candidatus Dormibacteraeota bacterium]|nr:TetR/AcrR family transcriptional regulator [Candidatus Dormibacteraeota bacterium]
MIDRHRKADRREALVAAAYSRIARQGFEGLRTRDVAAEVGVNIATLHYYFPTKEALIRGVVGHAMRRFASTLSGDGLPPAEQLRHHLRGVRRLVGQEPELFAVMGELALRSVRDPAVAAIFGETSDAWLRRMRALVGRGVAQGGLAPGLDPEEAAALIVAAVKGACMVPGASAPPDRVDQVFRQLERWLGLEVGEAAPRGPLT